jgi:hypothetical protein
MQIVGSIPDEVRIDVQIQDRFVFRIYKIRLVIKNLVLLFEYSYVCHIIHKPFLNELKSTQL